MKYTLHWYLGWCRSFSRNPGKRCARALGGTYLRRTKKAIGVRNAPPRQPVRPFAPRSQRQVLDRD